MASIISVLELLEAKVLEDNYLLHLLKKVCFSEVAA